MRTLGRAIGLDVHLQFCEVAIVEAGAVSSAGRIETTPEKLKLFAQSLSPADRVALEVTGSAWAIAEILKPHVAKVVVVSPARHRDPPGAGQDRPPRRAHAGAADVEWRTRPGVDA